MVKLTVREDIPEADEVLYSLRPTKAEIIVGCGMKWMATRMKKKYGPAFAVAKSMLKGKLLYSMWFVPRDDVKKIRGWRCPKIKK